MTDRPHESITAALREAEPVLRSRGVRVVPELWAENRVRGGEALDLAIRAFIQALALHAPRGATLRIETRDRAGGDVEFAWELGGAPEDDVRDAAEVVASLPAGDVLEVALRGLERVAGVRSVARGGRVVMLFHARDR